MSSQLRLSNFKPTFQHDPDQRHQIYVTPSFYPKIEYIDVIFLDHHVYPKLTEEMNNTYCMSINFEKYLNNAKDAFEDQTLLPHTIQANIIDHIRKFVINTTNVSLIDNIIDNKTYLMVTIGKDTCLKLGDDICLLTCALNFVPKFDNKNTLILSINWFPVFVDNRQPTKDVYNFGIFGQIPFPPPVQPGTNPPPPPPVDPNIVHLFDANKNILHQQNTMIQQLAPKKKS